MLGDGDRIDIVCNHTQTKRTNESAENKSKHTKFIQVHLKMATSYCCRYSSTMVMKNYIIDTPIEFLSLSISQLSSLTTLTKCFPNFFSLKKCSL